MEQLIEFLLFIRDMTGIMFVRYVNTSIYTSSLITDYVLPYLAYASLAYMAYALHRFAYYYATARPIKSVPDSCWIISVGDCIFEKTGRLSPVGANPIGGLLDAGLLMLLPTLMLYILAWLWLPLVLFVPLHLSRVRTIKRRQFVGALKGN